MYKFAVAATLVEASFMGGQHDPFNNSFFNRGGFGTPEAPTKGSPFDKPFFSHGGFGTHEKPVERSPFNNGFFNRAPEDRLFNRDKPFMGGLFNKDKYVQVSESPSHWMPFMGKREHNNVFFNQDDNSLSVSGALVADAGQSMTFDSAGLNGQGAKQNNFEKIEAKVGSTVTFALLLI